MELNARSGLALVRQLALGQFLAVVCACSDDVSTVSLDAVLDTADSTSDSANLGGDIQDSTSNFETSVPDVDDQLGCIAYCNLTGGSYPCWTWQCKWEASGQSVGCGSVMLPDDTSCGVGQTAICKHGKCKGA